MSQLEINKRSYVWLTVSAIFGAITTGLSIAAAPFVFGNPLFEMPSIVALSGFVIGGMVMAATLFSVLKRQNSFKVGFSYAAALFAITADVTTSNYLWGALGPYSIAIISAVALAGIAGIIYSGSKLGRPPNVSVSATSAQTTEPRTNDADNIGIDSDRSEISNTPEPIPSTSTAFTNPASTISTTILDSTSSTITSSVASSNFSQNSEIISPPLNAAVRFPRVESTVSENTDSSSSDDDLDSSTGVNQITISVVGEGNSTDSKPLEGLPLYPPSQPNSVLPRVESNISVSSSSTDNDPDLFRDFSEVIVMPESSQQDTNLSRPYNLDPVIPAMTPDKKENEKTDLLTNTTKEEPKIKLLPTKRAVEVSKLIHDIEQANSELHKAYQAYRVLLIQKPKNGLLDMFMDQVLGDSTSGDFSRANYDKWNAAMVQVENSATKLVDSLKTATQALLDIEDIASMEKLRGSAKTAREQVDSMGSSSRHSFEKNKKYQKNFPYDITAEQAAMSKIHQKMHEEYEKFIEVYQGILQKKQNMPSATRSKHYGSLEDHEDTPEDSKQNTQNTDFEPISESSSWGNFSRVLSRPRSVSPPPMVMTDPPINQVQETKALGEQTRGYGVNDGQESGLEVDKSFFRSSN